MVRKPLKKGKIPPFIKKIVSFLQNQQFKEVVSWVPEKNGFQILNVNRFSQQVLSQYFKHNNLSSFVRQLNMYGFSRPKEMSQYIYCHPRFQKGNRNSMRFIQRKTISNQKKVGQEETSDFRQQNLQNRQLSGIIASLMQENEQLKNKNQQLSQQIKMMIEEQQQFLMQNELAQYYNNFSFNLIPFFNTVNLAQITKAKIQQEISSKLQKQRAPGIFSSYICPVKGDQKYKGHHLQAGYKEI